MMDNYNKFFDIKLEKGFGDDSMNLDYLEKSNDDIFITNQENQPIDYSTQILSNTQVSPVNGSVESSNFTDDVKASIIKNEVSEMNEISLTDIIQQSSCFGLPLLENSLSTRFSGYINEIKNEAVPSTAWYTDLALFSHEPELLPATTVKSEPPNSNIYNENAEIAYEFLQNAEDERVNALVSSPKSYTNFVSFTQEPEVKNNLQLTTTFDNFLHMNNHGIPDSYVGSVTPYYPAVDTPSPSCSSTSSHSSYSTSASNSSTKRKHRNEIQSNAKRLKTEEEQIGSKITVYKTVTERQSAISTGMCKIMLPFHPYPYEPKLFLEIIGNGKYAYRFYTAEDLNTNEKCKNSQSSTNPKPPLFWCLQCGVSFGRGSTARKHSKLLHKNPRPVFKKSYFVKLDE